MGHSSVTTTEVYSNMNLKRVSQDFPTLVSKTLQSINKDYFVIHISTDQVYDGIGPHKETSANPLGSSFLNVPTKVPPWMKSMVPFPVFSL